MYYNLLTVIGILCVRGQVFVDILVGGGERAVKSGRCDRGDPGVQHSGS